MSTALIRLLNSSFSPGLVVVVGVLTPTGRWVVASGAVVSAGLIPALAWVASPLFPIVGQRRVARVVMARS